MPPENDNRPAAAPEPPSGKANPTPLDVLFILGASVLLLLLLLWMATTLLGLQMFSEVLGLVKSAISEVWTKVILGSAGAGTAILALRQYLFKTRPSLNFMIWIPATTFGLIVALFAVEQLVPKAVASQQKTPEFVHVPIRFGAELPKVEGGAPESGLPPILVSVRSPDPQENPVVFKPHAEDPEYPYQGDFNDMPTSPKLSFLAELNPILGSHYDANVKGYVWQICLKANPNKPFPAADSREATSMIIKLKCRADSNCPRSSSDPSPAVACNEQAVSNSGLLPAVYAAAPSQPSPPPGWVVPSLSSLDKVPSLTRPGYTRFEVKFTPAGKASQADHYYYAVKVNDQPVYIDGFLPDRIVFPLQPGPNWISFALENLNFTGKNDGFENLTLTVTFLKGKEVVEQTDVPRQYVALRDAASVTIPTEAGAFEWMGKYMVPTNQDVYEILVGSSVCASADDKECVGRIMTAKKEFDSAALTFNGQPVVVQVRPPLRPKPIAYGLALGVELPSREVKFTFSSTETDQFCQWAAGHYGQGVAGKIIQKDRQRYNVATRGRGPC